MHKQVAGLLIGGVTGVFGTLLLQPSMPPVTASTSEPDRPPTPTRRTSTLSVLPATDGDCRAELEELYIQRDFLQRQLSLLGGSRSEWPPDLEPTFRPAAIRAWLDAVLPTLTTGNLMTLDCDEYPCVGFFQLPEAAPASSAALDPLREQFASHSGSDASRVHVFGTSHGAWAGVAFAPQGLMDDAETSQRLQVRMEELAEVYMAR